MIIDLHTQVWTSLDQLGSEAAEKVRSRQVERWGQFDASPAAHERAMVCVDGSLVLGYRSDHLGACIPNEYVAEFVAEDPRRRVGIAGIDPVGDDALDQLDAAANIGLQGVAVSPACQSFHPVHSEAMRLYERCSELDMPVFILMDDPICPSAVLEFGRPSLWDEVARAFPRLCLVIGGLGCPWIDETLLLLGKHEHVFADISGVVSRPWQLYDALLRASSLGVMDRLLFGSGYPRETPAKAIETLYSINSFSHGTQLPSIPRSQIRGIVERDSLAALRIDAEIAVRPTDDEEHDLEVVIERQSLSGQPSAPDRV